MDLRHVDRMTIQRSLTTLTDDQGDFIENGFRRGFDLPRVALVELLPYEIACCSIHIRGVARFILSNSIKYTVDERAAWNSERGRQLHVPGKVRGNSLKSRVKTRSTVRGDVDRAREIRDGGKMETTTANEPQTFEAQTTGSQLAKFDTLGAF